MIRLLLVGTVLWCAASFSSSIPAVAASEARSLPMRFEWRREGPADTCNRHCRVWISAIGAITADTVREFEIFAQNPTARGATLVFDSEGGSVLGALALGRAIRRLDMTTSVGKTTALPSPESDPRARLSPDAYCESMCTFALLGGVRRHVPSEARVLVHQIWLGDRRNDALAATYSAEDLVLVQRDIGKLAQYTIEMGGDIDLLETALKVPPWEPMRALTRDEIVRMRLSTVDTPFDDPAADIVTSATPSVASAAPFRSATINARGWALVEDAGRTVLARRHPLTVEGENIGQFDLLIGCGANADTFAVTYIENRRDHDASSRTPVRLKDVTLSIARNSIPLAITSSETRRTQTVSAARGNVRAALVSTLLESESRAVTVQTTNTRNSKTAIRVGSSGFSQGFTRFSASCGNQDRSRSASAAVK